jgi:hypothetical protein
VAFNAALVLLHGRSWSITLLELADPSFRSVAARQGRPKRSSEPA